MKKVEIKFYDITGSVAPEYYPKPAKGEIPDWYKRAPSYINNVKEAYSDDRGFTSATIKKCIPVFDAISAGYILYTPADVQITNENGGKFYRWPDKDMVGFHAAEQVPNHPSDTSNIELFPKWNNPWVIQTPPGYSCLITSPMHRGSVFTLMEGVVDTDKYLQAIQFPFLLKDEKWHGTIPAGTPMAQVIPFKRESFKHKALVPDEKMQKVVNSAHSNLKSTFFNGYKDRFWSRKDYS